MKKPPGEGTGPTIHFDFRGNLVGRVPSRGERDVFQQTAGPNAARNFSVGTTAFSLPLLLKKEERAGERRCFLSISPLSDSLPAGSSRGERGKTPQAFCVPKTTGLLAAAPLNHPQRCGSETSQTSQTRAPNNPKGIGASSPRLACNAYLGCAFGNRINANGVVAEVRRARAGTDGPQPLCGWGCLSDDDPWVARAFRLRGAP